MVIILGIGALLALVFGPSIWARAVLAHYSADRTDFPGSGGELARHLLDAADLAEVKVETTDRGDHYDPEARAVRLSQANHDGRSVTAVAVAAHEVGHALQHRDGDPALMRRTRLVKSTAAFQRIGSIIVFGSAIIGLVVRIPGLMLLGLVAGVLTMAVSVVVHLVTLPVEYDASFRRALPILDQGGYLPPEDLPAARRILRACALTYVAASLASLLNLWRWIRFIR